MGHRTQRLCDGRQPGPRAGPASVATQQAFSQETRWPTLDVDRASGCIRSATHAYRPRTPEIDPARVVVIHNGVDTKQYRPDLGTGVLERLGIDPSRPTVVFVSRITHQKGIIHLLEAAKWIAPLAQLVLCTAAPDTPAIEDDVARRVALLGGQRHGVFWIRQMLPRSEVVQLLSHATVFVCPSQYEPFGLVNVEAMACGAPIVATSVTVAPSSTSHTAL